MMSSGDTKHINFYKIEFTLKSSGNFTNEKIHFLIYEIKKGIWFSDNFNGTT